MKNFEEMTLKLPDGYETYTRYWPVENPQGAVLHIHGIQSHCGWYDSTANALQQAGFAVLQPDRRGCGRNEQDRGHAESAEQLIEDAVAAADWLRAKTGESKIHFIGVSWGGKLIAAMHAHQPEHAASLNLIAPGIFPIIDVSSAEKFRIGWSMVSNPERHFPIPLNDAELFTADPHWIEYLESDQLTLHDASAGFFLASRRMDRIVQKLPKAPPVPISLFLVDEERIIDNERTEGFVRELGWPDTRVTKYEHSRHTIEFGPAREAYQRDMVAWLQSVEAGAPCA